MALANLPSSFLQVSWSTDYFSPQFFIGVDFLERQPPIHWILFTLTFSLSWQVFVRFRVFARWQHTVKCPVFTPVFMAVLHVNTSSLYSCVCFLLLSSPSVYHVFSSCNFFQLKCHMCSFRMLYSLCSWTRPLVFCSVWHGGFLTGSTPLILLRQSFQTSMLAWLSL